MRKSAAKLEKEGKMPETLPLAAMCALLSEEERQIRRIMQKAGIEIPEKGVYPVAGTIQAVTAWYRGLASKNNPEMQADIARKARNDADSSDIDLAEKRGLLMLKADARQLWNDGQIEMRRRLRDSPKIPEKLKPVVVEILQSVELNEANETK